MNMKLRYKYMSLKKIKGTSCKCVQAKNRSSLCAGRSSKYALCDARPYKTCQ